MRKLAGREAEGSVIGAGREEDKEWGMSRRGKPIQHGMTHNLPRSITTNMLGPPLQMHHKVISIIMG